MAQATKQAKEKNQPSSGGQSLSTTSKSPNRGMSRLDQRSSWSPYSLLNSFRTEMDRLFDDFGFGRDISFPTFSGFTGPAFNWSPQTEVFERGNELVVRADLPGLTKDDIKVDVEGNRITIRGERKSEHEEKEEGFYRSERSYGSFYRSLPLPEGTDGDKAKADFNNGVLEITMPLAAKQTRGKRIEIGTGGQAKKAGA